MTETRECIDCRKTKIARDCELCGEPVCKACLQIREEDSFFYEPEVAPERSHLYYCGGCYDEWITPALGEYQETLEAAKKVFVFFKTQKKAIPLISKSKESFRVPECPDRDETILRLAFMAAKNGQNAIVETDVVSEKVRMGAYQTSKWRGTAFGATIDAARMDRYE